MAKTKNPVNAGVKWGCVSALLLVGAVATIGANGDLGRAVEKAETYFDHPTIDEPADILENGSGGTGHPQMIYVSSELKINVPDGSMFYSQAHGDVAHGSQVFVAPVSVKVMEMSILADITRNEQADFTVNISSVGGVGKMTFKSRRTRGYVEISKDKEGRGSLVRIERLSI